MRALPTREGFTLVELVIVLVVVGVLAMIAVSRFWSVRDRGLQSAMQSDLRSAVSSQEVYFARNDTYASSITDLPDYAPSPGIVLTITYSGADGWAATTSHPSVAGAQCGLAVNSAPLASAPPASVPGVVACTGL